MTGASSNQYGVSAVQLAGGLWDDSQLRAVKDNRIRWYAVYRLLGLLVAHITVHVMHNRKAVPRKRLSFGA